MSNPFAVSITTHQQLRLGMTVEEVLNSYSLRGIALTPEEREAVEITGILHEYVWSRTVGEVN